MASSRLRSEGSNPTMPALAHSRSSSAEKGVDDLVDVVVGVLLVHRWSLHGEDGAIS